MTYDEYKATPSYKKAKTGAQIQIVLVLDDDPTFRPLGRGAGLNYTDTFGQNPVEEWGKSGVDEIAPDKHGGTGTLTSFFIPEQNDRMDTRATFSERIYTILEQIAPGYEGAGVVLGALQGVHFTSYTVNQAARGLKGADGAFIYTNRLTGQQFADQYGGNLG